MSGLEVLVFLVMWSVVILLLGLLLVIYRQVDRAYRLGGRSVAQNLLPAGAPAPPIEVLAGRGEGVVKWDGPQPSVIAFLDTGCPSCRELLAELRPHPTIRIAAIVSGPAESDEFVGECEMHWAAHPPDVLQGYGITQFPSVVAVANGHVLLATSLTSLEDYKDIVRRVEGGELQYPGHQEVAGVAHD